MSEIAALYGSIKLSCNERVAKEFRRNLVTMLTTEGDVVFDDCIAKAIQNRICVLSESDKEELERAVMDIMRGSENEGE